MSQAFQDGQPSEIYASASGMVGTPNSRGAWVAWIPAEGADFLSIYGDGTTHRVVNMGGGKYAYSANNGPARVFAYAPRWLTSRYYDAAGNPVSDLNAASAAGEPVAAYHQTGAASSSAASVTTQPATTNPESWTRSSDGRSDVWTSASGMAGVQNSRGAWAIFLPTAGLVIESRYRGATLRTANNGDGTYSLSLNGGTATRHQYDARWTGGGLFDARGASIASIGDASAPGDPVPFFTPGATVASGAPSGGTRGTNPPPDVSTPLPPVTTPPTPVDSGGGGGGGYLPGGGGIAVSPFPDPINVAPEAPAGGQSGGGLAVLAAIGAALSLLN